MKSNNDNSIHENKNVDKFFDKNMNKDSTNSIENNNVNRKSSVKEENNNVKNTTINDNSNNKNTQEELLNNDNTNININSRPSKKVKDRKKTYIKYFKEFSRLALKTPDILNNNDEEQISFSESRLSSSYLSTSFSSNNNVNQNSNSLLNVLDGSTTTSYHASTEDSNNLSEDINNLSIKNDNIQNTKNNVYSSKYQSSKSSKTSTYTKSFNNSVNKISHNDNSYNNNNNSNNNNSNISNSNINTHSYTNTTSPHISSPLMHNISFHVHHHHTNYHRNSPNYSTNQYESSSSSSSHHNIKYYPNYETSITPRILSSNGGSLREENAEIYYKHHPNYYSINSTKSNRNSLDPHYTSSSSSIMPSSSYSSYSSYFPFISGSNEKISNSLQSEEINNSSKSNFEKNSKMSNNNLSIITNLDYSSQRNSHLGQNQKSPIITHSLNGTNQLSEGENFRGSYAEYNSQNITNTGTSNMHSSLNKSVLLNNAILSKSTLHDADDLTNELVPQEELETSENEEEENSALLNRSSILYSELDEPSENKMISKNLNSYFSKINSKNKGKKYQPLDDDEKENESPEELEEEIIDASEIKNDSQAQILNNDNDTCFNNRSKGNYNYCIYIYIYIIFYFLFLFFFFNFFYFILLYFILLYYIILYFYFFFFLFNFNYEFFFF